MKILKSRLRKPYFGIFGLQFENTIVMFEFNDHEFV